MIVAQKNILLLFFSVALMLLLTPLSSLSAEKTKESIAIKYAAQIQQAEEYLSSFSTMSSKFIQTNPGHGISRGKMYISRPKKARWEYTDPSHLVIVIKDSKLAYYDEELNQVSYTDIENNPMEVLLRDKISLSKDVKIVNITDSVSSLYITVAAKADKPTFESLTLVFSKNPFTLERIHKTDSNNKTMGVKFLNPKFDEILDNELFIFKNPRLFNRKKRN